MEKKEKSKPRAKFYVEQQHWAVQTAIIFMALSAVFRIVGCWGKWNDAFFAATQIALPLMCNILFILCLVLLGKRTLWLTSVPVILGVVFFIIKSFTFESWIHTVLCILLYLLVAVLYTGTVFGIIRTKWLLVPLFGLPFLYHVFVEDLAALRDTANPVTLSAGLREISVLCVMLALLFTAIAMKKKKPQTEVELPKMKAPKVIPPQKAAEPETAGQADQTEEKKENIPGETK